MQAREQASTSAERFATPRGDIVIWSPSPSLILFRIRRHGESQFATHLIQAFDALHADRIHLFGDLDQMPTYDSDLRIAMTNYFAAQRERVESIDLVMSSKLVSLGVDVARLVLGRFIRPHMRRDTFTRVLDAAIGARGLEGFTSDVLRSP